MGKSLQGGRLVSNSRIFVDSGGNIGIGSTQPTSKLDITGGLSVTGVTTVTGSIVVSGTSSITLNGTDNSISVGSLTLSESGISGATPDINTRHINSTGIITATSFVKSSGTSSQFLKADGSVDSSTYITSSDNISGTAAGLSGSPNIDVTNITASGNVTIGGTLTYEDVTNVDSVGFITARTGINVVGGGMTVTGIGTFRDSVNLLSGATVTGVVTATSFSGDGSNLTGIDATSLKDGGGTVRVQANTSGAVVTGVTTSTSFVKSGGTSSQFLKADGSVDSSTYITSADGGNADQLDGQEGTYYLNYNNFTNTPTIPTNNNQLTNGAGYITSADGGNAATLDSLDSTQFLRSDAADTASGAISLSADTADVLNFTANSSNDARGISFNSRTALSADYNDGWLRLNNSSEFSNGVFTPGNFRVDGIMRVDSSRGITNITGQYGTIQTNGSGAGNWEGYSIDGRSVFMHDGGNATGIYNDVDNEWMFYGVRNSYTRMYHNGSSKVETTSSGVTVSGNVNSTSDIKLKKNIKTIDNALDKVLNLHGVYFDWKEEEMGANRNIGFIAQEVEGILPEVVTEMEREIKNGDGLDAEIVDTETIKNVSYGNITAVLIEAMKEQQKQIDTLTKRIEELGG